jgi:hypothetical protein
VQALSGTEGYVVEFDGDKTRNRYVTPDEVRQHIGLHTNANSLTRAGFLKAQAGGALTDFSRRYKTAK